MRSADSIVYGCVDAAVLVYNLTRQTFSRLRLTKDFSTTGCVWSIASAFNEGVDDSGDVLCCGGLSIGADEGAGLTVLRNDTPIPLCTEAVVSASFCRINSQSLTSNYFKSELWLCFLAV